MSVSTPGPSQGTPGPAAKRVALPPYTVTTTGTGAARVKVSGKVYFVLATDEKHRVLLGRVIRAADMGPRASLLLLPRTLVKLGRETLVTMSNPATPARASDSSGPVVQASEFHRASGRIEPVQRVCDGCAMDLSLLIWTTLTANSDHDTIAAIYFADAVVDLNVGITRTKAALLVEQVDQDGNGASKGR